MKNDQEGRMAAIENYLGKHKIVVKPNWSTNFLKNPENFTHQSPSGAPIGAWK